MPYDPKWSPLSRRQLRELPKGIQATLLKAVDAQLTHQPDQQTRRRKQLRPNPLATWELRVGDHRVFYNVDSPAGQVEVVAIGHKDHNQLMINGEEVSL